MKSRRFLVSLMLGTALCATQVQAIDVFNVYTHTAPEGCLEKDLSINKEVSLIDLIKIGICNNPELRVDYMSLKGSEANLGAAKSEYR